MNCTISISNIKVFSKCILSLSKISDEIIIEASRTSIIFQCVNSSRSAFIYFSFIPGFFEVFDTDIDESFVCSIAAKSLLSVFKSFSALEKNLEKCSITFDSNIEKLVVQLFKKHGIIKIFEMDIAEGDAMQAKFDKANRLNYLSINSKLLSDCMQSFINTQEEISIAIRDDQFTMSSYSDDNIDPTKFIHTEMKLSASDFSEFNVANPTDIVFCLRELKVILSFMEVSNSPLDMHFDSSGRPILFSAKCLGSYDVTFVLATLSDPTSENYALSQTSTIASSKALSSNRLSRKSKSEENKIDGKQKRLSKYSISQMSNQTSSAPSCSIEITRSVLNHRNSNSILDEDDIQMIAVLDKTSTNLNQTTTSPPSKKIRKSNLHKLYSHWHFGMELDTITQPVEVVLAVKGEATQYQNDQPQEAAPSGVCTCSKSAVVIGSSMNQCLCQYCGLPSSRNSHIARTATGYYECSQCDYKCQGISLFQFHQSVHLPSATKKCATCGLHLCSHLGSPDYVVKDTSVECHICNKRFDSQSALTKHIPTHPDGKLIECDICQFKCSYHRQLTSHRKHVHGLVQLKRFPCILCNHLFKSNADLKRHLPVHTKEKPYKCDVCSFRCNHKYSLNRHKLNHYDKNLLLFDGSRYQFYEKKKGRRSTVEQRACNDYISQ